MKKRISFSVIVPTFREAKNLPHLLQAFAGLNQDDHEFEVIIVDDDSQDGTEEVMRSLQASYPWAKLVVRQGPRGLSQSVIDGLSLASFPILITMDADLSHPVSAIPVMLEHLEHHGADMVVGSRYVKGGSVDASWPIRRKLISRLCALATKRLLRLRVDDPLSGFFAIKKSVFLAGEVKQAIGWKIGLELLVRCPCQTIVEVPIHFSERQWGVSKLSIKVGLAFARQLRTLLYYQASR